MSLLTADVYRPRVPPPQLADEAIPTWLTDSALGAVNREPIEAFVQARGGAPRDLWLAVVPGSSEQWGHHRAPPASIDDGTLISHEFRHRLEHALRMLDAGIVTFLVVSGGSVDASRPEYNEALRGRAWLETQRPALRGRVFVDPVARHSTTNLRNVGRLAIALGLERVVIATSMPPGPALWPRYLPVVGQTNQGWYFLHRRLSTFDLRCRRTLGYALGRIEWHATPTADGRLDALVWREFPTERLVTDTFGP